MSALIGNPLLLTTAPSAGDGTYQIERSLRFNSADSPTLSRTPGTSGNRRTYTISWWQKKHFVTVPSNANCAIISARTDDNNHFTLGIENDGGANHTSKQSGTSELSVGTGAEKFNDTNAWLHYCVVVDTTNAIQAERFKVYINGENRFTAGTRFDQNDLTEWNKSGVAHVLGASGQSSWGHPDITLADIQHIDGLALSPAAFGSFDSLNVWNPKAFEFPTPNNDAESPTWSGMCSGTELNSSLGYDKAFDGDSSTASHAANGNTITFTPTTNITFNTLEFIVQNGSSTSDGSLKVNGIDIWTPLGISGSNTLLPISIHKGQYGINDIDTIAWTRTGDSDLVVMCQIKVDGVVLVDDQTDETYTEWADSTSDNVNSFHLKFNDTSRNSALGKCSLSGKIADATGGLPIYNTDATGDVKGSGNRTDSLSGNLKLAIPGDNVTSTTMDVSSADHDVTVDGVTVSTDESRLYGSSLKFVASETDTLKITGESDFAFGTGDFCVEFWVYNTENKDYNSYIGTRSSTADETGFIIASDAGGDLYVHSNAAVAGAYSGEHVLPLNTWTHVAYTRASGTHRLFMNGIVAANASTTSRNYTNDDICIGANPYDSEYITAYMNDVRVYKGAAKYTANFTPPTRNDFTVNNLTTTDGVVTKANADSKPILGTSDDFGRTYSSGYETDSNSSSLVLAISGRTLADNHADVKGSGTNHSISNSSSTTSTSRSKFYGTAIATDGGSQHFVVADSSDWEFGSGEFTIEYWINAEDVANDGLASWLMKGTNGSNNSFDWRAYASSDGNNRNMYCDLSTSEGTKYMGDNVNSMPNDEWVHFAVVRDNTDDKFYLYKNGVKIDDASVGSSATMNDNYSDGLTWGYFNAISGGNHYGFEGWVNDIRIYKGFCKYPGGTTFDIVTKGAPEDLDSLVDSPTNYGTDSGLGGQVRGNYCTLNSLDKGSSITLSNGNLDLSHTSDSDRHAVTGTVGVSSGKWYYEATVTGDDGKGTLGFGKVGVRTDEYIGIDTKGYAYNFAGQKVNNGTSTAGYGDTYTVGDTIGVALDLDSGTTTLAFYKNGTSQGNAFTGISGTFVPIIGDGSGSGGVTWSVNFGQREFENTAPSGFKSLCTQNLDNTFDSEDSENNPSKYFDVIDWVGDDTSNKTIGGLQFQPDVVWTFRLEGGASGPRAWDAIRGVEDAFNIDNAGAAYSEAGLKSFTSDGFTVGSHGNANSDGDYSMAIVWDAGTAGGANTDGTVNISSPNQWVNTTAGFSLMKVDTDAADTNFGHGLNAKPLFMISKFTGSGSWYVYHDSFHQSGGYLYLNDNTGGSSSSQGTWKSPPDNTKIYTWDNVADGDNIVMAWTPIAGYSAFGSWVGNNSSDGPFVYTGFSPKFILYKANTSSTDWQSYNTTRNPYNPTNRVIEPNTSNNEVTGENIDILSNGFKIRNSNGEHNGNNEDYCWAAWAEHPFKIARAR